MLTKISISFYVYRRPNTFDFLKNIALLLTISILRGQIIGAYQEMDRNLGVIGPSSEQDVKAGKSCLRLPCSYVCT